MAIRKPTDFDEYRDRYILPYATQMFGVYQPLLGLRSRLAKSRIEKASVAAVQQMVKALAKSGAVKKVHSAAPGPIGPDTPLPAKPPAWLASKTMAETHRAVSDFKKKAGRSVSAAELKGLLHGAPPATGNTASQGFVSAPQASGGAFSSIGPQAQGAAPSAQGQGVHEAVVLGTMQYLSVQKPDLAHLLVHGSTAGSILDKYAPFIDPLSHFDPATQKATLSPIGLIQLYRQYFFELDSFLGPAVGHVWVSPGGSLEVYEVHTRKRTDSRETEQSSESKSSSEKSAQEQDDLSTAMSRDNTDNMTLGVTAQAGVNFGVFSASASTSYNTGNTQKQSEQTAHKETRSQSSKVASELRKSYKSTFKTTLEQTDTQSRRYVLSNPTDKILNIELCRKMRKVGVQVQHVGTQLCWQVFVDNPGEGLCLSDLVHLAQPADLSGLQPPEAPPVLLPKEETRQVTFPFVGKGDNDDNDDDYVGGVGSNLVGDGYYRIENVRKFEVPPPAPGYLLKQVTIENYVPSDPSSDEAYAIAHFKIFDTGFDMILDKVDFDESASIKFTLKLLWKPPAQSADEKKAYEKAKLDFKIKEQQMLHAAFVSAVRDRVKVAREIAKRPEDDLRAEERTVVYRQLLGKLVEPARGYDSRAEVAHVTSELIRAMFDVDSMLYFVAPDWWRPHRTVVEKLPVDGAQHLTNTDLVGWGGGAAHRAGNYLITEESAPAPLGASLGWTMQLDGDDRRNAFLNAPWVKAVIPIRPGMEEAALNWLTKAHVEGTDGLGDMYVGDEPELKGKTVGEALHVLAENLRKTNTSIDSTLKTEKVYERGFDPLEQGFNGTGTAYEVFDQWVEVLPTDQVVAVEYTPKRP